MFHARCTQLLISIMAVTTLVGCATVAPSASHRAQVLAPAPAAGTMSNPAAEPVPAGAVTQAQLIREVAAATGKNPAQLAALLDSAVIQPSILAAMRRPAESKPWSAYRPIFVNPSRIAAGIAYYQRHHALLDQVAQRYGVPPQFIVAIIGVETDYGNNTGNYRVLDALTTLAFHYPPREKFFQGELRTLLELPASKLAGPIPSLYGSYAGAMGLGQFMPSSIKQYAVDAEGDGHIDLYASLPDAFASIANYFKQHGWQTGQPVATRADVATSAAPAPKYTAMQPTQPLARFTAEGYTPAMAVAPTLPARLLALDGADGPEYWLTFQNFYVITRYNRSPMYALAVTQLADAIARGVAAQ